MIPAAASLASLDAIREKIRDHGYFFAPDRVDDADYDDICNKLGPIIHECEIRVEAGATSYFKREAPLAYHTDSPFARYVVWLCLVQQDIGGEMLLKDTKHVFDGATPAEINALNRVAVRFPAIEGAHGAGSLPLLSGDRHGGWRVNYAPWLIVEESLSPAACRVLAALGDFPGEHGVAIALRPGSVLIIDNRRMLHGRGELAGDRRRLLRRWIGD
ncbi:alpha-ketoglutarate-dependent taurine dioxygenase [Methylosinus sp. sav-2]|jgi:hypothetical protein|uniref:TauD/TfdA family dioxygenase n=1 Tax=unclassified Methylosinus TaxID=2624500 RepID=UPI000464148E|nr:MULTISPECIES: TauD/TfdA family dioxygenase [unclassified Methylosinus]TDX60431.1 alpha-ketoglutarate-dependent taurine dioxygenase [Methylosinus sp. sav-2]